MNRKVLLPIAILLLAATACGPSRTKSEKQIDTLEKRLYSGQAMNFNRQGADSLLMLYERFVKRYPKDTVSPRYLFHAAGLAMTLGDGKKSISLYEKFMNDYPENPKAPVCLFFKGYINENMFQNYEKAREIYLQFIEKYPDNEFVKDARAALNNLGKTPEQLVREFEEKQKAEQARVGDSLAKAHAGKSKGGKR